MNADTRSRIVMTAMDLFWEKGFQSTSVADILSRTQVHSGSLYHFFPGKQDVLAAVLEAYRDGIEEWLLEPAWSGVDDPIERIFALLDGYRTQLVTTDCTYGCPIGSLALELHEPDPAIRDLLSANFANWTAAIERCLDAAGDRLPAVARPAAAGRVHADRDGGRGHAGAHLSRHRQLRPQHRGAARAFRHADRNGEGGARAGLSFNKGRERCPKSIISRSRWRPCRRSCSAGCGIRRCCSPSKWVALTGQSARRSSNPASMAMIFGGAFLLNLIAAYVLAMFIDRAAGIQFGALAGLAVGLCWVATSFGVNYLFERRPLGLWLINAGYFTLQFTVMGAIIGGDGLGLRRPRRSLGDSAARERVISCSATAVSMPAFDGQSRRTSANASSGVSPKRRTRLAGRARPRSSIRRRSDQKRLIW